MGKYAYMFNDTLCEYACSKGGFDDVGPILLSLQKHRNWSLDQHKISFGFDTDMICEKKWFSYVPLSVSTESAEISRGDDGLCWTCDEDFAPKEENLCCCGHACDEHILDSKCKKCNMNRCAKCASKENKDICLRCEVKDFFYCREAEAEHKSRIKNGRQKKRRI